MTILWRRFAPLDRATAEARGGFRGFSLRGRRTILFLTRPLRETERRNSERSNLFPLPDGGGAARKRRRANHLLVAVRKVRSTRWVPWGPLAALSLSFD